ncbi:MAG: ATP-binding cassette domain-containing protein, partial [Oscillospiraceae bacterium]|nr:ATP-binding cassette domain-containing protein [Oscillospiraceae bacterium]
MSDFLQTEKLNVGYNGKTLIHDISLSVKRGEIITLIGPNGAGKSTILKTITGHLAAIAGTVVLDRDELGKIRYRDLAKKLAVMLTDRAKPELMTCHDVVAMGRYPYTGSLGRLTEEDHRLVNDAMEMVNVLDLAERNFDTLSDGQRQRVLLARAICQEPEILVLDEPTSFLDIRYKVELFAILKRMAKERQTTIVMSLHEIDLAQKLSDKVLCIKGDHIEHFGSPDEIYGAGLIPGLYDLQPETYNPLMGSVELEKPDGKPEVFVLSSCGSGIPVYRRLQRQGIPFAAGVLYENDVDTQVARSLASELIEEKPFDILDLNMGCPVPKVVNNGEGSALMKTPELAAEIVRKTVKAIKKPVTVKIRKGFDEDHVNAV